MAVLEYLGRNALALAALLISLTTASVQLTAAYRNRRRTRVSLTQGSENAGGQRREFVIVTIANVGGPIGIQDIWFAWLSGRPPTEGYGWTAFRSAFEAFSGAPEPRRISDVLGVRRTLQDGESWVWHGLITTASYEAASKAQRFQAEVHLTSGRVLKSNELYYVPVYNGQGEPPPDPFMQDLPELPPLNEA